MRVQKKQQRQKKNPVQRNNPQKQEKKIVAKQNPVKRIKTITIAEVIVSTILADVALLHRPQVYQYRFI